MAKFEFDLKLKEKPVSLIGVDGVKKDYILRELTGEQRQLYNDSFNVSMGVENGEAKIMGEGIRLPSAKYFLSLCLYDDEDKLVEEDIIGGFPDRVVSELQKIAMELSSMNAEALEEAKNELKGSDFNGKE